jgi:hypothetical protein
MSPRDDLLQIGVSARVIVRHAEVADAPCRLPVTQRGELRLHIGEIVHLHQVEALYAKLPHGVFHLPDTRLLAVGPHLGGDEELRLDSQLGRELTRYCLRGPVHGRAIDDAGAQLDEDLERLLGLGHAARVAAHVEALPGAETHRGQRLSRLRDAPLQEVARAGILRHQHSSQDAGGARQECAPV